MPVSRSAISLNFIVTATSTTYHASQRGIMWPLLDFDRLHQLLDRYSGNYQSAAILRKGCFRAERCAFGPLAIKIG
jgi:hypothetical protein